MNKTKRKPVVGDTLYMVGIQSYTKHNKDDVVVTKVGRKYFYISKGAHDVRFFIDTWKQDNSGYAATAKLYESKSDYDNEVFRGALLADIVEYFRWTNRHTTGLSLKELTKISEIINS